MPKKSTRDSRSIGRTSWKPKSVKRNSNEKRILNNIYIGAGNARRWIILKKKLDYQSDVDFVAFLLDLAEPHSVKQVTTKDPEEDDKKDDDDEDENEIDLPLKDFEEDTNDSASSILQEISDDGEWKPSSTPPDGPLRRSPRKPPIPLRIHVRRSARNVLSETTSSPREQKDKIQLKEEKKKKEKKGNDDSPIEGPFLEEENKNKVLDENIVGEEQEGTKEKEEREVTAETNVPAVNSELECVPEGAEEMVLEDESHEAKNDLDKNTVISKVPVLEGQHKQHSNELEMTEGDQQAEVVSVTIAEKENTEECLLNISDEVRIEVGERVKLKRRKKKRSHSVEDQNADHSHSSKHKRKKHKHGEHSTKKKHHDIRKAPQDGVLKEPTENVVASVDCTNKEHGDSWMEEMGPNINEISHPEHHDVQVELPEQQQQQRVAIRIKLCCDCNSRHIQDACPLRNPSIIIGDAVIFGQWKNENCTLKCERTNVILGTPASTDNIPVINCESRGEDQDSSTQPELVETLATLRNGRSEFHEASNNGGSETRDSIFTNTQKIQSDRQEFNTGVSVEKWERTNCSTLESADVKLFPKESCNAKQKLTFAEASLPLGLELQVCEPEHGPSVVTRCKLQQYTQFGPLVGQPIREMDIPDDFNMKDIWEVFSEKERLYLSTFDPNCSNWLRYVRPAPVRDQRNLVPIVRHGELYFVTVVDIAEGEELLYWADDTATTWSKKKMEKTNCGGCNLRFSHPLYYRMHCTVFHDPNFSLTIRKYHCKVCGTAVLGKENIMKHAAEMHDGKGAYQCQYCKKFFLRLNYLEMHRTYGCASNPQRTRPLCDFCGRKFCQPQKLKVHIKRMHSDMAEVLREFQCKICLKLLGSRAALQRHMKEVHHKDIVGACTCDRCGKMFQNKSNLKIHMLTHSGVKPFKCRENGCVAAFTTKQCLQFHYKKVHRFSEETMPVIERSVAYTFDAYSGGIVEEPGRGKTPRFEKERRNSTDNNSSSLMSMDDSSSASSVKADVSATSSNTECNSVPDDKGGRDGPPRLTPPPPPLPNEHTGQQPPMLEPYITQNSMFGAMPNKVVMSKGSKKWMGDAITTVEAHRPLSQEELVEKCSGHDVYEFEEDKEVGEVGAGEEDEVSISIVEPVRPKTPPPMYRRPESNASLLVEAALNAAERDIDMSGSCSVIGSSVNSPTVITASDIDKQNGEPLYSSTHHMVNGHHHDMTSSPPMHHSSQSPHNNHLGDYTLQQAGRELVSPATTPDQHPQNMSPEENSHSNHLQHLDGYALQRDEMTSSPTHHLHRPQVIDPYNLHHQEDLISPAETPVPAPSRSSHLVDGYNLHHQEEIMSPAGTPDNHRGHIESYSLHHQEELVSPAATPTPRYEMHHHQVPTDNLSSDEGEGVVVAQNLSLGVKEKALQLDLAAAAAAYKQYEALEAVQEFGRERPSFEPLLVGTTPELQGLDMSARSGSGYHHSFVSASSQSMSRYHHASVLYDMASAERQSVDLSMTGRSAGYAPSPPPYSHSEVLRVVSLDLTTPVGRHSVDLSLSRSSTTVMSHHAPPSSHHSHHHHHQLPSATRVMTTSPDPRVAATPAPPGTPNHVVPELSRGAALMSPLPTVGSQGLVEPGRIISPPPHPGYQSYPLSPSPYHPPSRTPHITSTSPTTYHHYSGYY